MRVLAFLYPGHECWNAFAPIARLLGELGHELTIADFGQHLPSASDASIGRRPPRIPLADQGEAISRMDRRTYLGLYGDDVDFAGCSLFYHTLERFPLKRQWLFLDSPYYQRLYLLAHRISNLFEVVRPDLVICAHGVNPLPSVAVAKSVGAGLPVLVFESAFVPGRILLDPHGAHFLPGMNRIDRLWPEIAGRPLLPAESGRLDGFLSQWVDRRVSKYEQPEDDRELARLHAFVDAARNRGERVVFLPDQIPWDASILLGLDHFRSWDEFVQHVVAVLPEDTRAVMKLHPKRRRSPAGLPGGDRTMVVDQVNVHTLFGLCDSVCTFSSNAGFEALLRGLPVVVGGRPHYAGRGFTRQLSSSPADRSRFTALNFNPEQRELFRRYAHHVIFDFLVEENDAAALDGRIAEAVAIRGRQFSPRAPFTPAFPQFTEEYLRAVSIYNDRAPGNGTHAELADGIAESLSPGLRLRMSPDTDVDIDGLAATAPRVTSLEEMDPVTRARYAWAAATLQGDVLDLGSGWGAGSYMISRNGRTNVTGVDASRAATEFARVNFAGVRFEHTTAAKFTAAISGNFDAVVCFGLLESMPDAGELLHRIRECLKPGGLLLASFPNRSAQILERPDHVRHFLELDIRNFFSEDRGWGSVALFGQWGDGTIESNLMAVHYLAVAQQKTGGAGTDIAWTRTISALRDVSPNGSELP